MENNTEVPQKIKNNTIIWPSNPTSQFIPKGNKYRVSKIPHVDSHVYCSIIHNTQDMEITYVPINRRMDKADVVHNE